MTTATLEASTLPPAIDALYAQWLERFREKQTQLGEQAQDWVLTYADIQRLLPPKATRRAIEQQPPGAQEPAVIFQIARYAEAQGVLERVAFYMDPEGDEFELDEHEYLALLEDEGDKVGREQVLSVDDLDRVRIRYRPALSRPVPLALD